MVDALFDADHIRAATFIRHVEIHERLGSTNDRTAELVRAANIELPALIVAQHQTAGRGRGQNTWWSADGALTFSVLLEPAALGITTTNWPQLSLTTAVAVCDALDLEIVNQRAHSSPTPASTNPQSEIRNPKSALGIKWPNDIMLEGRKVGGILLESPGGPVPTKDRLIIGVGINVNNSWREAPQDAGVSGTALTDVTGRRHDLQIVLLHVLKTVHNRFVQLGSNNADVATAWQDRCVLSGRIVRVASGAQHIEGKCRGIANDGAIIIEAATGLRPFYSGTLRVVS